MDALSHILARRHELAGTARRLGKPSYEGLGDCAAHPDREYSMAGTFCTSDQLIGVPDFSVSDEQEVARQACLAPDSVCGIKRGSDLGAAHVSVERANEAPRLGQGFLRDGHLPAEHRTMAVAVLAYLQESRLIRAGADAEQARERLAVAQNIGRARRAVDRARVDADRLRQKYRRK
ncbi:MAG: hypothetical protein QGI13_00430 [Rhodospirillales bacterium]|jgi:hypothetical protein|nr:hypothetical protein [Rhodospirillales bacterium]